MAKSNLTLDSTLKGAWSDFSKDWKKSIKMITLLGIIPITVIYFFIILLNIIFGKEINNIADNFLVGNYTSLTPLIPYIIGMIILGIAYLIFAILVRVGIILWFGSNTKKKDIKSKSWNLTPRVIKYTIGYILIFIGLILGLALLIVIPGSIGLILELGDAASMIFILYAILVGTAGLVGLMYLGLKWSMWAFFVVLEGKGLIESLKSSSELIKNNWWRTVGYYFIINLISGIVVMPLALPQGVFENFGSKIVNMEIFYLINGMLELLVVIASLIVSLYVTAYMIRYYKGLKQEKGMK